MNKSDFPLIFDGHNDTVHLIARGDIDFLSRSEKGHLDLPRAVEGGMGGGFYAVYLFDPNMLQIMADAQANGEDAREAMSAWVVKNFSDVSEWPDPLPLDYSQQATLSLMGSLFKLEKVSAGKVKIVRTATELETCLQNGVHAVLLHFEGAEMLDVGGDALEVFHAAGLRSVGPTHSRKTIFCQGVPLSFPASPDIGPGLTEVGRQLIRDLNRLNIMIDLAHINEKGFWEIADLSDAPLVATHSNAWELCKSPRNLTNEQLKAIGQSGGVAGLNFHVGFLAADGNHNNDVPLSVMVDHVEHMVEYAGIDSVALGSDFDGCTVTSQIKDAAGLPVLMDAIRARGYSNEDLTKLAHGNWVRVLRETWGE